MGVSSLNMAKRRRDDEFYTPFSVIAAEIPHYGEFLQGKSILCNCRDLDSQFHAYDWYKHGVRKAVFVGTDEYEVVVPASRMVYKVPYPADMVPASYDDSVGRGVLSECDIVITNPPFSKIRHFVKFLVDHKRDFILIVPVTFFGSKIGGNLLVEKKFRVGYTRVLGGFTRPDGTTKRLNNCVWITSFPVKRDFYTPSWMKTLANHKYETYDELPNVLFVDKARNIPMDYEGVMAVPLSFMEHYNEEQFELVDARTLYKTEHACIHGGDITVSGKYRFSRILVRRIQ